jgi:polyhydroxyalkanoate synthesis regulator phasin
MTTAGEGKAHEAQLRAEEERARLSRTVEKLILASIGAVALGQDSLESFLKRLVERGERVQETARRQADALRERGRHIIGPRMRRVEATIGTMDLPSHADIQSLRDQIAILSAKIDQLAEEKGQPTTQAQPTALKETTAGQGETHAPGI